MPHRIGKACIAPSLSAAVTYLVKELFLTLQGEGAQTGRRAVFCRFAGCNLWSGREQDRARASCTFCDTDFVGTDGPGGGRYSSADDLARAAAAVWNTATDTSTRPYLVCTGGEPLLQLDEALIEAFHQAGFEIAIETNGTVAAPAGIDWICMSPKAGTEIIVRGGDELKLVYPQAGAAPEQFENLEFARFFLQPLDGPNREANTAEAVRYCLAHPRWRLSLQTHKFLGIP
jgi:7-carboxy-7-deazaguanine synthase